MRIRQAATTAGTYALFAAAATSTNLAVQWAVTALWPWQFPNLAALAAGTGAGLGLKYLLDRRWIFGCRSSGIREDAGRFLLYTLTGVATTALFWGTELGFLTVFRAQEAKYLGALLGLGIGYTAKYWLDARLVFRVARNRS